MQSRKYEFDRSVAFGNEGTRLAMDLLRSGLMSAKENTTIDVRELEASDPLQSYGVDLLWTVSRGGALTRELQIIPVEVKADRHHSSGNFFLETESVVERDVEGAFLNSHARFLIYTFPEIETAHVLLLNISQQWFRECHGEFREKAVQTRKAKETWTTKGRLVPIARVHGEVPGVKSFRRKQGRWSVVNLGE